MEGFSFLFRIPNAATRARVLNQRLWSIEGQTMFVADWEPGIVPMKPELTSAPIWLELRNVPLQFFNDEGLERIASLVGDPKFLHPATANKTNLEVAKRVAVSSPWMPPVCSHCKEIGHSVKRCKRTPITCLLCNSSGHASEKCTRPTAKLSKSKGKALAIVPNAKYVVVEKHVGNKDFPPSNQKLKGKLQDAKESYFNQSVIGESSAAANSSVILPSGNHKEKALLICSEVEPDSSDVDSSESEEEGELKEAEEDFIKVLSRKERRNARDKGPSKH
ncbi:uncharacterized protein LOC112088218 [Eutrema salsugineum]|uniref:uncharacterized protein LOC112088218 n=1 Tax=Eutrema salsugineum TaxID=72664 RepID=UPI000CED412D|nr:uncharacterized protein LOC112088218 [Eutrema salsugineum]